METLKQTNSEQEITRTVELNTANGAEPSVPPTRTEASGSGESAPEAAAPFLPPLTDANATELVAGAKPKPSRALVPVKSDDRPALKGGRSNPSGATVVVQDTPSVRLVGQYDLSPQKLSQLLADKRELIGLEKLTVRTHFVRAALMFNIASLFAKPEDGLKCLRTEFNFTPEHIANCLSLHRVFAHRAELFVDRNIPATVGYEIASSEEAFREEVLERFNSDTPPTVSDVIKLRRQWKGSPRGKKASVGPSLRKALRTETMNAAQETTENLSANLKLAAAEMDRVLTPTAKGTYRLAPASELEKELGGRCVWIHQQLTMLVRPVVTPKEPAPTVYHTAKAGALTDRGIVALLSVTFKLSKVNTMKIRTEMPWIVNVAAPVLRWAAGRKVDGIDEAIEGAIKAMSHYDRDTMLKAPKSAT